MIVLGGWLSQSPGAAEAATPCAASARPPYVSFTAIPGQPTYDNTQSRSRLRALNRAYGQPTPGWSPIGLTLADRSMRLGVTVRSRQRGDGSFCSELASVEASVRYDSMNVYIASEYRKGSCQYGTILDHERRHVGVFNDTLSEFSPRIEQRLYALAGSLRPLHSKNRETAARIFQDRLERAMQPVFAEFDRLLTIRNAALDTQENYRKELENCLSW